MQKANTTLGEIARLETETILPLVIPRGTSATHEPTQEAVAKCYHCNAPLRGARFSKLEKNFCCQGCLIVFELLADNGLCDFYKLGGAAGVKITNKAQRGEFDYLDEPEVRERLVNFSDVR